MKNSFICILVFIVIIVFIRVLGYSTFLLDELTFTKAEIDSMDMYSKFLIPLITVLIGFFIFRMNKNFEHTIVLKTKVIDKRVEYYSEVSEKLNDIYTYLIRVGDWKGKKPEEIIKYKREISKVMYISKPFWSEELFNAYRKFILSVFETNTGHLEDAKIKADTEKYKNLTSHEKTMFTGEIANKKDIKLKYLLLEKSFSKDMGVYDKSI